MNLVDAIQQYQAIVYEISLEGKIVAMRTRKDLPLLRAYLTKVLGLKALKSLTEEAKQRASRRKQG